MIDPREIAALDAARDAGDDAADAVVAALGRSAWAINALLKHVERDDQPFPAAVPDAVRALVAAPLPAWADRHRLYRAQCFAQDQLVPITVALFCASLPSTYAAAEGVEVLQASGRMRDDVDRRVNETARFVLEILRPHSFEPGGRARVMCGKVRFIHAAVRAALVRANWTGPTPINQRDMLGTLLAFSVTVLRSLIRLGVTVSDRQREDFLHLWCVAGALLGIPDELLPRSFEAAARTTAYLQRRLSRASEGGRQLMAALAAGYERHLVLPGGRDVAIALVRYLLDDELTEILGLPLLPPPRRTLELVQRTLPVLRPLPPKLRHRLLDAITTAKLEGARVAFPMPTQLRAPARAR